jgi:hypothetical protein
MPFDCKPIAWAHLASVVTIGLCGLASSCAQGSPNDTAEPPGGDGGSGGNKKDGSADDGSVGGKDGSTGGTAGHSGTGGSGGSGGTTNGAQCDGCTTTDDCRSGYKCVTSPAGDKFCAQDCASGTCDDSTTECVDLASYASGPDGGAGDDDGGAVTGKACVPAQGGTCPCTAAREGHTRTCSKKNTHGTCLGTETCTSGQWVGCDAPVPATEVCDGKDNNCNGYVDLQEPGTDGNQLCAGGSAPPHSGFTCNQGQCELSGCESGWARYPPNLPVTAGCACPVDSADVSPNSNDTCALASDLGTIPDVGGTPITAQGTLSSDADQDWYKFIGKDVSQVPTPNSYRIHVEFLAPDGNPGDEFRFDVVRVDASDPCPASGAKTELTSYDWCSDVTTNPSQPGDADQTKMYRVRVYRKPGATGTCNSYKLRITNGGSGACPPPDACGAS